MLVLEKRFTGPLSSFLISLFPKISVTLALPLVLLIYYSSQLA